MGTRIDDDVSDGDGEALLLEFVTTEGDCDGLTIMPCVGKYVGITVGSELCCPGDGDTVGL